MLPIHVIFHRSHSALLGLTSAPFSRAAVNNAACSNLLKPVPQQTYKGQGIGDVMECCLTNDQKKGQAKGEQRKSLQQSIQLNLERTLTLSQPYHAPKVEGEVHLHPPKANTCGVF